MDSFVTRHYRLLFIILTASLIGLSFYGGILYGKGSGSSQISLSCSPETLSELTIPTKALAAGSPTTSVNTSIPEGAVLTASATSATQTGKYVGSKNGTKYYAPTCGSVKRIKPENYKWFQTTDEAELQGYTRGSC